MRSRRTTCSSSRYSGTAPASTGSVLNRKPSHLADRQRHRLRHPGVQGRGRRRDRRAAEADRRPGRRRGRLVRRRRLREVHPRHRVLAGRAAAGPARALRGAADRRWPPRPGSASHGWTRCGTSAPGPCTTRSGIGTGSEEFGFAGDHDVWRLPEADDELGVQAGRRDVLHQAPAGVPGGTARRAAEPQPGRPGVRRRSRWPRRSTPAPTTRLARLYLDKAAQVFAQAKTTDVGELVTAFPHAYYPEDSWQDDMEFGAAELAVAARAAVRPAGQRPGSRTRHALGQGLHRQRDHGHPEPVRHQRARPRRPGRALRAARHPGRGGDDRRGLVADLRRQLDRRRDQGRRPSRSARRSTSPSSTPPPGPSATWPPPNLYRQLTGDRRYDAFGTQQRNWALGAQRLGHARSSSARGSEFPHCPQHQVANLAGSLVGGKQRDRRRRGERPERRGQLRATSASRTAPGLPGRRLQPVRPISTGLMRGSSTTSGPGRAWNRRSTSPRPRCSASP